MSNFFDGIFKGKIQETIENTIGHDNYEKIKDKVAAFLDSLTDVRFSSTDEGYHVSFTIKKKKEK